MKKRLLLAAPDSNTHICDLIYRDFDIVETTNLRYRNGYAPEDTNFDAVIHIDGANSGFSSSHGFDIETFAKLNNIPIIGTKRFDKSIQLLFLRHFKINTPDTYFVYKSRLTDFTLVELLNEIPDNTRLLLKIENGARGLGQLFIKKKDFINYALNGFSFKPQDNEISSYKHDPSPRKFSNSISGDNRKSKSFSDDDEELMEDTPRSKNGIPKFVDAEVSGSEHIMNQLSRGGYIIQKYLDIKQEYRYLYFHGEEPIIIERKRGENQWQANSCVTGIGNYIEDASTIPKIDEINDKITKLANHLNTPFLSVDVYIDADGNFGIFEFQMEFGIVHVPHEILINRINDSVQNLLHEKSFVLSK